MYMQAGWEEEEEGFYTWEEPAVPEPTGNGAVKWG